MFNKLLFQSYTRNPSQVNILVIFVPICKVFLSELHLPYSQGSEGCIQVSGCIPVTVWIGIRSADDRYPGFIASVRAF